MQIPPKPPPLADGATEQQQIQHTDDMQAYWFAIQQQVNRQRQEATAQSNISKAEHDAMMAVASNMK